MACINFEVYESRGGWFVGGGHPIGPFYSRNQAVELAESMVAAVLATGEQALVVINEQRFWMARLSSPN